MQSQDRALNFIKTLIAAIALISVCAATATPDETILGKADVYPAQRFGREFSLLIEKYKVGTFSNMDRVLFPREVPSASLVSPLSVQYPYNGQTLSLGDFLKRQRIIGLLILKGNPLRQYWVSYRDILHGKQTDPYSAQNTEP